MSISWVMGAFGGGRIHGPPYIFCLLLKKSEKVQEHDLHILKSNSTILHHFDLHFFSWDE